MAHPNNDRPDAIDPAAIESTHDLIRPYIRLTPVIDVAGTDFGVAGTVVFKLEQLQYAGSFKSRGAFAHLLTRQIAEVGAVAASGGNHGAAVAYAAQRLGVKARIFVPTVSPPAKVDRIRQYGAELVIGGDRYADALAASEEWVSTSGASPIHAFDQTETLLGQGTIGLELDRQADPVDSLLVAVGGGGLIAGIASWYRSRTRVIGVEPENAPTMHAALEAGEIVDVETGGIAVDSLGSRRIGTLVFPIAQQHIEEVLLVTDDEIRRAQEILWESLRVVAEPGGATAFAALLAGAYVPEAGERVGVLISGANTVPAFPTTR